jgi:hypothetical protein
MWDIETLRTSPALREILDEHDEQVAAESAATAKIASILRLLATNTVRLTDVERNRIWTCRDLETLDDWFEAALTATSSTDLFGE